MLRNVRKVRFSIFMKNIKQNVVEYYTILSLKDVNNPCSIQRNLQQALLKFTDFMFKNKILAMKEAILFFGF